MAVKCEACPLRRLDRFAALNTDETKFMQRFKVGELTVDPQTSILVEGANSPQLYTVLSGMGLRAKSAGKAGRQVLNFVFPGDFLGLQLGIMGEMGHTVEATTQMTLCVFDRNELWSLFKTHPDRAFDLTWLAAAEECFLGEALTTIGQRSALEAVAWALLSLYRKGEALDMVEDGYMHLPFRQQDLADALGLSLVHTNKTLAKLKDRQIVTWTDGRLAIRDEAALIEIIGQDPIPAGPRPLI